MSNQFNTFNDFANFNESENEDQEEIVENNENDSDFEMNFNNYNFFNNINNTPSQNISKINQQKLENPKSKKLQKLDQKKNENLKKQQQQQLQNKTSKVQQKRFNSKKSFLQLGLIKPLLKACSDQDFIDPTPIQELSIPAILTGRDVLASSVTGSGKTAAFLLPILQKYHSTSSNQVAYSKVLIIIPTRELAIQCFDMMKNLNKYTQISACLIIGGNNTQRQQAELRRFPDIIISTPGRLIDIIKNSQSIDLDSIEVLVFDEADKLLEMGFQQEIHEIVKNLNQQRQTLLFSATLNPQVLDLVKLSLNKPIRLQADPDRATPSKLTQEVIILNNDDNEYREAILLFLILNGEEEIKNKKTIVFFKTKKSCHRAAVVFRLLLSGDKQQQDQQSLLCELHGDLEQEEREEAFQKFKENQEQLYLFTTDLAARGIDIKNIELVINFELPVQTSRYIHRVGRTARAGNSGKSITFCNQTEYKQLEEIMKGKDCLNIKKINQNEIKKCLEKIKSKEDEFLEIIEEEKLKKEIKMAEIESTRAENIMKYKEEIFNRPKKVWIMNKQQKKHQNELEREQLGIQKPQKLEKKKKQMNNDNDNASDEEGQNGINNNSKKIKKSNNKHFQKNTKNKKFIQKKKNFNFNDNKRFSSGKKFSKKKPFKKFKKLTRK